MRTLSILCLAVLCTAAGAAHGRSERAIKDAVVHIFTVYNEYDFYRPWQMKGKLSKTGSGCIIDGNRVLTNAHVVADRTFIQVRRAGHADKFVARVQYVGHECDLALLTVADERFFEGAKAIRIGKLPHIRQKVAVYGFPRGGTKIAITEGVVSRVENLYYSHSQANLLCCQIDAPINSGSSGGPVLADDKLVGVAFQSMSGENIGYMVPAPVVEHFLADVRDGQFDGFPSLALSYQTMENPDLRAAHGVDEGQSGILINRAYPLSPCRGMLDSGDVLLAVEGFDIANDASVEFRDGERTLFEYPAQSRQIGDSTTLTILREGEVSDVRVELDVGSTEWKLVPRQLYDTPPRYLIVGGFVFVPLTRNFLETWGGGWRTKAPRDLVQYYFSEPDETRREVVVIGQVLADEVNVGYEDFLYSVVSKVNGREVADLEELKDAIEENDGEYHEIIDEEGYRVVLSRTEALERKHRILKRYRIAFDRSPGLGRDEGVGVQ